VQVLAEAPARGGGQQFRQKQIPFVSLGNTAPRRHGFQTKAGIIQKCRPSGGGPACAHSSSYDNGAYAKQCGGTCLGMRAGLVTPSVPDSANAPVLLATGKLRHYDTPFARHEGECCRHISYP